MWVAQCTYFAQLYCHWSQLLSTRRALLRTNYHFTIKGPIYYLTPNPLLPPLYQSTQQHFTYNMFQADSPFKYFPLNLGMKNICIPFWLSFLALVVQYEHLNDIEKEVKENLLKENQKEGKIVAYRYKNPNSGENYPQRIAK